MDSFEKNFQKALQATDAKASSKKYTIHAHFENRDGTKSSFWTQTGLSKSAAQKLAAQQRREGGKAKVIPEGAF